MDKPDAILNAIEIREKEHFLLLSLSSKLAQVSTITDLEIFANQHLKNHLLFEQLAIGTTDSAEINYKLFFHTDSKVHRTHAATDFEVNDGIFNAALNSADPLFLDSSIQATKKNKVPHFITESLQSGIRQIIVIPLQYHKNNPSVLFLFYRKPQTDRVLLRLAKALCFPLALTVSNIIVTKKMELGKCIAPVIAPSSADSEIENTSGQNIDYGIIGNSPKIIKVLKLVNQVAESESGVLLLGESGTGKEVVARAIHKSSLRNGKVMIKVNCAAIPTNLIESELFGHEKGSFTGATDLRVGKFELADGGTLFLDEIGELPLELQTKLLRVLQEREIERIGGKKTIKIDVRIIAATNRDLQKEVAQGRFRTDLFYRLNIFPITLPPLRKRTEDIELLSKHFISVFANETQKKIGAISAKALKELQNYSWPGNVRELENILERSVLLTKGTIIKNVSLPKSNENAIGNMEEFRIKPLHEMEKEYILKVVKLCNGRISGPNGAALKLQIPATTLISKMEKLGIRKEHFSGVTK